MFVKNGIMNLINDLNVKKNTTNFVGNRGLGLGQVQKWGWIKPDKTRSQPTLDNWIYNGNTYLKQREKK